MGQKARATHNFSGNEVRSASTSRTSFFNPGSYTKPQLYPVAASSSVTPSTVAARAAETPARSAEGKLPIHRRLLRKGMSQFGDRRIDVSPDGQFTFSPFPFLVSQKLRKKTSKLDAPDPDPPMSMEACRAMVFHDESLSRYPDMSISMAAAAKRRSKAFSGSDSEGVSARSSMYSIAE
ncbi:hypothetical protein DFP72DRAFT_913720 [Ephemerocybe angulata]|uniref:Uncharacterized protein n=1 Tax=Ephemerocybe angulata TaxID=980116 RepID=A0A8H6M2J4_9AGAR|nr:hypothetical protein DFP72DRAFT_913720 [Tulosesus angulatus]